MTPITKTLAGLALWEAFWWWRGQQERKEGYTKARQAADIRRKPLLVVGEPDGEYPCGDVTVDLRERSKCPTYVRQSVESLPFQDKQFGAAFISFTLEQTCNPQKALQELHRVADEVVIVGPSWWRLTSYLVPGRQWLAIKGKKEWSFRRLPGTRCNKENRYGTPLGDFRQDAIKAMSDNPSYFATWYTLKSFALVGTAAALAYVLGRNAGCRR